MPVVGVISHDVPDEGALAHHGHRLGRAVTPSRNLIPRPPQNRTTFMVIPRLDDLESGIGEDQPAAPRADVLQLVADLVP